MRDDLYNSEGYLDPTAFLALRNIERESKKLKDLVFICSPFAGDIEGNIRKAKRYGRFAVSLGRVPIIPHLMYPQFLHEDDPVERKIGLEMGLVLLTKCREIWVFGEQQSPGMTLEFKKAAEQNMIIRRFSTDCRILG
ncbi:MAG: DUF4406 domain-containing protein, partial [Methanothrix sp.]